MIKEGGYMNNGYVSDIPQVGNFTPYATRALVRLAREGCKSFYAKTENRYGFQLWCFERYGKYYDFHSGEYIDELPKSDIPDDVLCGSP